METSYLVLGSNAGDRHSNLEKTIEMLRGHMDIHIEKVSSIYATEGVDSGDSMPEFLNCAIKIKTDLSPYELLSVCQNFERDMGRERLKERTPRIIDIDIILYDDQIINTEHLILPHPRALTRRFVLVLLYEIEPGLNFPGVRKSLQEIINSLPENGYVRKLEHSKIP